MRLFTCTGALCLAVGCGPAYGRRVPDALVQKLPYEMRIELLEAENNLGVALDRVDEAQNEVMRCRDNIRRAKERRSAAKDEVGKASDDISRQVADLAVTEAEARYDFLRAKQKVNVANTDVEALALRCAFAEYEAARLAAARKAKVEGSEKLAPEDFDKQVKDCKEEVGQMRQEMKEREQTAAKAKDEWDQSKTALAKKTFDARASPYVE
jgi:chromosome segregation ATPase